MGEPHLAANDRRVLTRFLVYLLRDGPSIHLGGGQVVEHSVKFRAESRKHRKKRLRVLRERRKKGLLTADEQQILDGLERTAVHSSGYASVSQRKSPGKRAGNSSETRRLYVAKLVYEKLCPGKNSFEFLENNTDYCNANARALEMRIRQFETEHILTGQASSFQIVESFFSMFKGWATARRHPELYQGFPRLGIPPANIARLAEMMRI